MSSGGDFRMHRSLFGHWAFPKYAALWLYLIGHAVYRDGVYRFCGTRVRLLRGQLMTALRTLGKECGMSKDAVRTFLIKAEECSMISRRTERIRGTRHGTIRATRITITNYNRYQGIPRDMLIRRDKERDEACDIEEASSKKQAAAAGRVHPRISPDSSPISPEGRQYPPELHSVVDTIRSITAEDVDWPAEELDELVGLSADVPWPTIRARVEDLTLREKRKGKRIRSLRYHIRAIREDYSSSGNSLPGRHVGRPQVETAATPLTPAPPDPPEPDWGLASTSIQIIMESLRHKPDEA